MNHSLLARCKTLSYYFASFVAVVSFILLLVLFGIQMYTRWYLNKDFTLLGGNELEVFTAATFALIYGLTHLGARESK
jgi:hypothetical protein